MRRSHKMASTGPAGLALALVSIAALAAAVAAQNSNATAGQEPSRMRLGVFMESLCPDTRRFFLRQLVPTSALMGQVLDLQLVPFGHARTLGSNRMICQHGARECEGNRRMACLLARSQSQSDSVKTLGCLFSLDETKEGCVAKHMPYVKWDELEKCTAGPESYALMVSAEKETGKLDYVPHLTLNGQSSEAIQEGAEHRLKEFLCRQYKGPAPLEACKDLPPAVEPAASTTAASGLVPPQQW